MEWKRSGVLKLIELFKREPVLWKLSHPNHKNFNCRIEAMKRIAEKMETTPSDVEKKLHTLRSQYLREKVKIVRSKRIATCAGEIYTPKWQYYKILSFLPSTSKPENTNSMNLVEKLVKDVIDGTNSIPEAEIEGDANNSSMPSQAQLFGELVNGSPSPSPQVSASRKRNPDSELSGIEKKINLLMTSSVGKARDENISFDDFVAEEVTPTIRKRNPDFELSGIKKKTIHSYDVMTSNSGKARDEDTCFGDFVTEALKKLPDRRMKAWVRSKITNILFEAEFGGESSQPPFQPHPMHSSNFVNSSQKMHIQQHSSQNQSPYNSPNSSYASSHSPTTNDPFRNNSPLQIQITPD